MRADQQLNLSVAGDSFQILCDDAPTIALLADLLAPWIVSEQSLPGFKIVNPVEGNKMWVLLGTDGGVLARSREQMTVVRTLLRHVAALASPQAAGTMRLGLRAVEHQGASVLVDPALLKIDPPIERSLAKSGLTILDSQFVETCIGKDPHIVPVAFDGLASTEQDVGHGDPATVTGPIRGLLWAANPGADTITRGQLAHALASVALSGSRDARLDFGIFWADKLPVQLVNPSTKGAVLSSAGALLESIG